MSLDLINLTIVKPLKNGDVKSGSIVIINSKKFRDWLEGVKSSNPNTDIVKESDSFVKIGFDNLIKQGLDDDEVFTKFKSFWVSFVENKKGQPLSFEDGMASLKEKFNIKSTDFKDKQSFKPFKVKDFF